MNARGSTVALPLEVRIVKRSVGIGTEECVGVRYRTRLKNVEISAPSSKVGFSNGGFLQKVQILEKLWDNEPPINCRSGSEKSQRVGVICRISRIDCPLRINAGPPEKLGGAENARQFRT